MTAARGSESRKATLLAGFFGALHALVLGGMWLRTDGRVAQGVVVLSVVPLYIGTVYLLRRVARRLSWLDVAILLYAAWSVASVVQYFQAGNPTGRAAYAYGLYHFVLPISCYYAAKSVHASLNERLVSTIVVLNAAAVAIGLYMYIVRPDFYVEFLHRALTPQGATEDWQYFARMQSYLGSTSVGYMGASSLVLVSLATPALRRLAAPLTILFVAGSALSLQRASLVAVMLGLAYLIFAFREQVWLRALTVATVVGVLIYGMAMLESSANPLKETLEARVTTDLTEGLSTFMSDRGYGRGLGYLRSFPLGIGVGGTSSAADNAGLVTRGEVADANFMRIAADLGIPGLIFFLVVLSVAAARAWTSRHRLAWLTFLTIHCGIMLSTNVFDSYYVSHSFWLLLAVLDHDRVFRPATEPGRAVLPLATSDAVPA